MRTTIKLEPDVLRAVERLRRDTGMGLSAAVNTLARRGLGVPEAEPRPFEQSASSLGEPRVPVDDVAAALELLEGETHR